MKRVQSYTAPGITVTFDPNVCVHSAVCLRTLPAVFDVRRRRWIDADAASAPDVAAAIDRCPSGALRYVLHTDAEAPAAAPAEARADGAATTIQTSINGPLLVKGDFHLLDEDGTTIERTEKIALCRCGSTASQPFCDGSHRRVGFQSKKGPAS